MIYEAYSEDPGMHIILIRIIPSSAYPQRLLLHSSGINVKATAAPALHGHCWRYHCSPPLLCLGLCPLSVSHLLLYQ